MAYHNDSGDKARQLRPSRPEPPMPDDRRARRIVQASWLGTGLLVATAIPAAIAPHTFVSAAVIVSLLLFLAGTVAFVWAYLVAIGRSRTDLIGMGGLFFLAGSAPRAVQRSLWASLAVEVVVAVATASARPFTPLAFGVLAPMFGLGVMGLWGAKFGTFPPRPPDPARPGRRKSPAPADPS
ncbi:MAG TPA: hypothetical protein VIJ47_10265 [Acidimicrobiales bacterium]